MYSYAIPASILIEKYPGMCIARPNVFKRPHESILSADDILLPGNKYFIIRSTTVEKIKRRHTRKGRINEPTNNGKPISESKEIEGVGDDHSDDSICSGDFIVSKESWAIMRKHVKERRQFVPPIQRPRMWKEIDWEPSLTSIREYFINIFRLKKHTSTVFTNQHIYDQFIWVADGSVMQDPYEEVKYVKSNETRYLNASWKAIN
ncbi:hypothetical protein Sango_1074900 [Sesamum angolense]|uniref:Uncharacterized protein n=1 Tax=Sesamum angolense TaxID=2727404 RepID=A0AAE1WUR5_9LAMI|nr:hypothetical protein Sango_1074900 [Sesamum angolense]